MSHTGKLALLAALVLRPGLWDADAAAWSKLIPHDWPGECGEHWEKLVETKAAEVVFVFNGSEKIGFLVFSIESKFSRPELIVLGAFSPVTRHDLTATVLPQIEDFARARGCGTVRFNTMRPGLISKSLRAGFVVSEVIMRKEIT